MIKEIGIRREDKNRWERRTPLTPEDCAWIARRSGVGISIQPSKSRVFSDAEYREAGVNVSESLSHCDLILGIKEMPPHFFERGKVYLFFSHVIKGQAYNMPMLKAMMEKGCTLIDYEKITDHQGRRLLFFGNFAGMAGMIDTLWALGKRLEVMGFTTPFLSVRMAHRYNDLEEAKDEIRLIGEAMETTGLPGALTPFVAGFAGYGNVSKGAQEVFDLLPHIEVSPGELDSLPPSAKDLYKVVFREEDMVEPERGGGAFNLLDYYENPGRYRSKFSGYLPYLSILINGIYWDKRYPRLVTKGDLESIYLSKGRRGPIVIGDISCDREGAIEATVKFTDPDNPVFLYDPLKGEIIDGIEGGEGPVILAIDNLPAELPRDASRFFSAILKEYIEPLTKMELERGLEGLNLPPEIEGGVILKGGGLTPPFRYLQAFLDETDPMLEAI